MPSPHRLIAVIWTLIGLSIATLTVMDVARVGGEEIVRSPTLLGAVAVAVLLAGACVFLGSALWRVRQNARRPGIVLSILFSVVFLIYGAANAFIAIKAQYAISFAAVLGAILGLVLCFATFRLMRQSAYLNR